MKIKRLFLFAAYDKDNKIDSSLVHYVSELSKLGDVVFYMDNNCENRELKKVKSYCLFAHANKHGEYDWGSYKKGYLYAKKILKNYEFFYLVNDSVYGPLTSLKPILERIESKKFDAFGMVCNPSKKHPHIQSWFIGMRRSVFLSDWFDEFMRGITKQSGKGSVTHLYEHGFTKLVSSHGLKYGCLYTVRNRGVYNKVKLLYKKGLPFIKKNSFGRSHGALGRQILYILNDIDKATKNSILKSAKRIYGEKYIKWFLTKNPIKIVSRKTKHCLRKIFIEGI